MHLHEISIATMTWGRNLQERELLSEALHTLATFNLPTFITDGGTGPEFVTQLQRIPQFNVFAVQPAGVWGQMKRSLQAANETNTPFILYTEPDKKEFFRHSLRRFINLASSQAEIGVTLAARSAESFTTFPAFQQYTEAAINRFCQEFIEQDNDYTYGPFLVNRKLLPYLKHVKNDLDWGWRPFLFALAHRLGYGVEFIVDDFPCPPEQPSEYKSERLLRMRQLSQSIEGLIAATMVRVD
jgi:hypothetical protein